VGWLDKRISAGKYNGIERNTTEGNKAPPFFFFFLFFLLGVVEEVANIPFVLELNWEYKSICSRGWQCLEGIFIGM
jgi:hypothetical protein